MTLSIMTFSIRTLSIKSLNVTLSIKGLYVTLSINGTHHNDNYADCRILFTVMPDVVLSNVAAPRKLFLSFT